MPRRDEKILAVDFDGTIVDHCYPEIGGPVPGALASLRELQDAGVQIILFTMRSGETLDEAAAYLKAEGIELYGVNVNPRQGSWTASPKAYAHAYVDDAAAGTPMRAYPRMGSRPCVNWEAVMPDIKFRLGLAEERPLRRTDSPPARAVLATAPGCDEALYLNGEKVFDRPGYPVESNDMVEALGGDTVTLEMIDVNVDEFPDRIEDLPTDTG